MIRSMTAFARHSHQSSDANTVWELRAVNHRYLELHLRLPEALRALEPQVRDRLNARLGRGKLECTLRVQTETLEQRALEIDQDLLHQLLHAHGTLAEACGDLTPLPAAELLRWPGLVRQPEPDTEALAIDVLSALDHAIEILVDTREREGQRISHLIEERLEAMRAQVDIVRQRRPQVLETLRQRLLERLAQLEVEVDPGRLEQELVLGAQRLDVDEELDRLAMHLSEISDTLQLDRPSGRRLDFLMQELNREANTLSSKSHDAHTTRAAVDMKVLIEQMREQIQNIE